MIFSNYNLLLKEALGLTCMGGRSNSSLIILSQGFLYFTTLYYEINVQGLTCTGTGPAFSVYSSLRMRVKYPPILCFGNAWPVGLLGCISLGWGGSWSWVSSLCLFLLTHRYWTYYFRVKDVSFGKKIGQSLNQLGASALSQFYRSHCSVLILAK